MTKLTMDNRVGMNKAKKVDIIKKIAQRDWKPIKQHYGTVHEIVVDGKPVKEDLAKTLDQVVLLSKSVIWNNVITTLDKYMEKYWKIPEEQQVRTYPDLIKLYTQVGRDLKDLEYIQKNYTNATPRKAQLINDEEEDNNTMIDVDIFKKPKAENFPYDSIKSIMRDKSLSFQEKKRILDDYMARKYNTEKPSLPTELILGNYDSDDTEEDDEEDDLYLDDIPDCIMEAGKTDKTPKEMFIMLCNKFPKRFIDANQGRGKRIGWQKQKEGKIFVPTLITLDPAEAHNYIQECKFDSRINYKHNSYYIPQLKTYVDFIRTNK